MLEILNLLGAMFVDDDDIPKGTPPTGLTGVYLEPVGSAIGNPPFVTIRILHFQPNINLPGMGTLFFDIKAHDLDQAAAIETLTHISETYPIPLVNRDGIVGDNYRCDELHFIDTQFMDKPMLTPQGGADHYMPLTAWAVIKPVGISSP